MYESRGDWVGSRQYRGIEAETRAYWGRAARGMAEAPRVHSNVKAYGPELVELAPGWGRLAWEKQAAEIEAKAGNAVPALPFDASDEKLRDEARAAAAGMYSRALAGAQTLEGVRKSCEGECEAWGIAQPDAKLSDRGALARLFQSDWWVRRLRASHGRRIEGAAQSQGYVHSGAACYVSDVSLARRQDQKARNAKALERASVVNQFGDEYTLAELAEKSNANPRVRSAELLTRIRGFELIAGDLGHVAEFWTMTAPSRMHAVTEDGKRNPKWDGTDPRAAQAWLCQQWARFRAWAQREGVEFYGFRVAEPHHDGCPHWHLLLFMPDDVAKKARKAFHRYALVTQESEALRKLTKRQVRAAHPGMTWKRAAEVVGENQQRAIAIENADKSRVKRATKFVRIDEEQGGAVGYIIKYISKNIDGYKLDRDLFGNEAVSASQRVEAWAATWGIRQFQQLGGAPVGVWRELRKLKAADDLTDTTEAARKAADVGKNSGYGEAGQGWADYLRIQGGAVVPRKELRLRVAYTREGEKFDPVTESCEPAENCYGEPAPKSVFGVLDVRRGRAALSRRFKWERGSGLGKAEGRAAWTRVNNCTQGGSNAADGSVTDGRCGERSGSFEGARGDQHRAADRQDARGQGIEAARRGAGVNRAGAARHHVRSRAPERGGLTHGK